MSKARLWRWKSSAGAVSFCRKMGLAERGGGEEEGAHGDEGFEAGVEEVVGEEFLADDAAGVGRERDDGALRHAHLLLLQATPACPSLSQPPSPPAPNHVLLTRFQGRGTVTVHGKVAAGAVEPVDQSPRLSLVIFEVQLPQ